MPTVWKAPKILKLRCHEMIRKTIHDHKRIIFNGNGYNDSWIEEATQKRGLLNYRTTPDCMPHLLDEKNVKMLTSQGVYSKAELESRCEIMLENYCKAVIIEANTMIDMAQTQIAPAVEAYTAELAQSAAAKKALVPSLACSFESSRVEKLSSLVDAIAEQTQKLEEVLSDVHQTEETLAQAEMIRDRLLPQMDALRSPCDEAETLTARKYWPFPTYGDLLFGVK